MAVFNRNYLSWGRPSGVSVRDAVTLRIFGDDHALRTYRFFSSPHPRFPFIPTKSLGAALLNLELPHRLSQLAKRKTRQAARLDYVYDRIDVPADIEQLMEINRSLPVRGGEAMEGFYLSRPEFEAIVREHHQLHVVRCPAGRIVAYAVVPDIGDLWLVEHVLGHGEHLKSGVMYLLMTGVISQKLDLAQTPGKPRWIMYDTLPGSPGRRQFKSVLGFQPYWVRWRWGPSAPSSR